MAMSEWGVDRLTASSPLSNEFKVEKHAVMVSAAGLSPGDKIVVASILSSNMKRCKSDQAFIPSMCGCHMALFKDTGDTASANPVQTEHNQLIIDIPGVYYLIYLGEDELGVEIFKKNLPLTPADSTSARDKCCVC